MLWRDFENRARNDEKKKDEWGPILFPKKDIVLEEQYWVNSR